MKVPLMMKLGERNAEGLEARIRSEPYLALHATVKIRIDPDRTSMAGSQEFVTTVIGVNLKGRTRTVLQESRDLPPTARFEPTLIVAHPAGCEVPFVDRDDSETCHLVEIGFRYVF